MRERRTSRRYKVTLPVTVRRIPTLTEADVVYGETRDISTGGLYFRTRQELAPETRIDLSFSLPTNDSQALITAQAKVLRVRKEREDSVEVFGMAVLIEKYWISRAEL